MATRMIVNSTAADVVVNAVTATARTAAVKTVTDAESGTFADTPGVCVLDDATTSELRRVLGKALQRYVS